MSYFEDYIRGLSQDTPQSPPADIFGEYIASLQAPAPSPDVPGEGGSVRPASGEAAPPPPDAPFDLAVLGGTVVLPESGAAPGSLYIRDGKIAAVSTVDTMPAKRSVRADGKLVIPGVFDPHIHLGLFNPFHEDIAGESAAAIVGGVTTAGLYVNADQAAVGAFEEIADQIHSLSHINILPHFVINRREQLPQIPQIIRRYGVRSFKVYLHGVPGLIESSSDAFIVEVMTALKQSGEPCVLCAHSETHSLVMSATERVRAAAGASGTLDDWAGTHPEMAEEEAILRMAFYAKKLRQPVYIVHISSRGGAAMLAQVKRDNPYITGETTSPYLTLNTGDAVGFGAKMEPPIRTRDHQDALWDALMSGVIDTVGTDNVPLAPGMKQRDNVWEVPSGYSVLETHLPGVLTAGVIARRLELHSVVAKLTMAPAKAFGLYPRKGTLLPGSDADIAIVDLNAAKIVDAAKLHSACGFSPYQGMPLSGWPVMTILGGEIAAADGEAAPPRGRIV